MFLSDKLIYIQMQKTGCTHIAELLSKIFNGQQIGKHNAANQEQINSNRLILSSIRNPWEWYLSLWAYGVQGQGGLHYRLTNPINSATKKFRQKKEISKWASVYSHNDNVASFRKWLRLIHDPRNSHLMGEQYNETIAPKLCGFMTYRYLHLCCAKTKALKKPSIIDNYTKLAAFEIQNCYINTFIRQEILEDSLCNALNEIHSLSPIEKAIIFNAKKTNTSRKSLNLAEYYDSKSIELIRKRDKLIIEKFNYLTPRGL